MEYQTVTLISAVVSARDICIDQSQMGRKSITTALAETGAAKKPPKSLMFKQTSKTKY